MFKLVSLALIISFNCHSKAAYGMDMQCNVTTKKRYQQRKNTLITSERTNVPSCTICYYINRKNYTIIKQ
jgi:hypothetical protein